MDLISERECDKWLETHGIELGVCIQQFLLLLLALVVRGLDVRGGLRKLLFVKPFVDGLMAENTEILSNILIFVGCGTHLLPKPFALFGNVGMELAAGGRQVAPILPFFDAK